MRSRVLRGLVTTAIAVVVWAPVAHAGVIESVDGRDEAAVDISRLWHGSDDERLAFGVDTHEGFDTERDIHLIEWDIDGNGDQTPGDACILLEQDGSGGLRASLFGACGSEVAATADATRSDEDSWRFEFPLSVVRDAAGLESVGDLGYTAMARDLQGRTDVAPDGGLLTDDGVVPSKLNRFQARQNGLDGSASVRGVAGVDEGSDTDSSPADGRPRSADAVEPAPALSEPSEAAGSRLWWIVGGILAAALASFVILRLVHVPDTSHL